MKTISRILIGALLVFTLASCQDISLKGIIAQKVTNSIPLKVLMIIANSASPNASISSALTAYPNIAKVDFVDSTSSTPTLTQMQGYDVVFMCSDYPALDMATLSNNLAQYLDGGGRVILGAWDWSNVFNDAISGRLLTQYSPFQIGGTLNTYASLGTHNTSHPIMSGVSSFTSSLRDSMTLSAGATDIADWNDSIPLVAEMGHVIAFNVGIHWSIQDYPVNGWTGDGWTMLHNAIVYIAHK